jgi:hypothetical protein
VELADRIVDGCDVEEVPLAVAGDAGGGGIEEDFDVFPDGILQAGAVGEARIGCKDERLDAGRRVGEGEGGEVRIGGARGRGGRA